MYNAIVLCEKSGIVTNAIQHQGFNVFSVDLEPGINYNHKIDDCRNYLNKKDIHLIVAFPPCTYLTWASNKYWNDKGRIFKRIEAMKLFAEIYESDTKHICIENPLGCIDTFYKKHDQIIHPYYFGDTVKKRTCLWLKNLPKLEYSLTNNLFGCKTSSPGESYIQNITTSEARSKFHYNTALAMAKQFCNYIKKNDT